MRTTIPGKPGRYVIHHPDQPMSVEDRAFEMWAVHPLDLDGFGMSREDFYAAHLRAAIRQENTNG